MKFRVVGTVVPDSTIIDIPPGVIPLNVVYPPDSNRLTFVCLVPVEDVNTVKETGTEEAKKALESSEFGTIKSTVETMKAVTDEVITGKMPLNIP